MIALYIVLSVLLLLFLIALIPVTLTLKYKEQVELTASALAIKFQLHPRKKKKVKISDYSQKKAERRKKKALRKRARGASKKAVKKQEGKPQEKKPLLESLEIIYKLLSTCAAQATKHVKIKTTRIVINVATDDAAKTAMLYAAVSNSVLLILTFLDSCGKLKGSAQSTVSVNADFLSEKSSADIEISFTLRVWHIAKSLFVTALKYVTQKSK